MPLFLIFIANSSRDMAEINISRLVVFIYGIRKYWCNEIYPDKFGSGEVFVYPPFVALINSSFDGRLPSLFKSFCIL